MTTLEAKIKILQMQLARQLEISQDLIGTAEELYSIAERNNDENLRARAQDVFDAATKLTDSVRDSSRALTQAVLG
jgi:hypothetical protein